MGRSFESVRMGVKDISARWLKASKALKKEDQIYGQRLAEMARKHSSEASMLGRPSGGCSVLGVVRDTERYRQVQRSGYCFSHIRPTLC
jgi:hypothetical protein